MSHISSVSILSCKSNALSQPKLKAAMIEYMNVLEKNKMQELTDQPSEKHNIGCKWFHALKCNPYGLVQNYNARFVAKVFTQAYGNEYLETFSLMEKNDFS